MTFGKATRLETLIPKLVTQIALGTTIPAPQVIVTLAERHFEPGGYADKYVLVTKFSGTPIEGLVTGGGELATGFATRCEVAMLTRLDLDQAGRDFDRLTDAALGLLAAWRKLAKALQMWAPDDGGTPAQGLLMDPARLGPWSIRDRNFRDTNGWVEVRTTLLFNFLQDLS